MNATQRANILRRVRFSPYRKGMGPTFELTTWDTGRTGYDGKSLVGYRLTMREHYNAIGGRILKRWRAKPAVVLFEGEDFGCSPLHCIDSDDAVAGIMGFLTLRPGDTDSEYFAEYTPEQLEFCSQHAEWLSCCVDDRFNPERS
jgi:hypothetical protein